MNDRRVMLSMLWLFATLNYVYCDVVGVLDPVKHVSFEYTPAFLFAASVLVEIPIAMVLLSRLLPDRASRWANVVAGVVMTLVQAASLFVAVPTAYYVFFSILEIACTAFIVWHGWTWTPSTASPERTIRLEQIGG